MYCYRHTLKLAAGGTRKKYKLLKDALETTREITKLIKHSPCREGIFQKMKEEISSSNALGIRILCPTRCTIRSTSLASILCNFETMQSTWGEATYQGCS